MTENIFVFLIIGGIQAATEFIPVSSSGHLAVFEGLVGTIETPGGTVHSRQWRDAGRFNSGLLGAAEIFIIRCQAAARIVLPASDCDRASGGGRFLPGRLLG